MRKRIRARRQLRAIALGAGLLAASGVTWGIVTDLGLVARRHAPQAEHVEQQALRALVETGQDEAAFEQAFELGDELFETVFNALDGVGANVGRGQRFTRVPRADLRGPTEWASHVPARTTGPNAQACNQCHDLPFDDGAGSAAGNVHRDPRHTARLDQMIQRNTPHLFAPGAVQRLAEEMTTELQNARNAVVAEVCAGRGDRPRTRRLEAKGVEFGTIGATLASSGGSRCPPPNGWRRFALQTGGVRGVASDLVIRPFQWKGSTVSLRDFNRNASHNELGMQAVELAGAGRDGDFDGVVDELSVGDQTALAVYLAAQPRPVTRLELDALGLLDPPLTDAERAGITRGVSAFSEARCAGCHVPLLALANPVFSEPSQHPAYRDAVFPAGQDPVAAGVDPAFPVTFDLTRDQPDNRIVVDGREVHLGAFPRDSRGQALVALFSDLKRHDMGSGLAEPIDEEGTGASVFLTEALWGVGSTAPYLHDGRATTLTEAILEHGGEAAASRSAFLGLAPDAQDALIAFLENLVLFKLEEEG
jgi:cytochrome c peroxidase